MKIAGATFGEVDASGNAIAGSGNSADNGGAIRNIYGAELEIEQSVFAGNIANDIDGGAIHSEGDLTLKGVQLIGNYAVSNGGAVYATGNISIDKSDAGDKTIFRGNSVDEYGYGGAIYRWGNSATITDAVFDGNSAGRAGGAIYEQASSGQRGSLTIKATEFSNNTANYGGAIASDNSNSIYRYGCDG